MATELFGVGDISALVQGGALGIAIALILLLALVIRFTYKMMAENSKSNNEIIMENARAMTKLAGVIDTNTDAINRNTRVTERVERVLDNRSS